MIRKISRSRWAKYNAFRYLHFLVKVFATLSAPNKNVKFAEDKDTFGPIFFAHFTVIILLKVSSL